MWYTRNVPAIVVDGDYLVLQLGVLEKVLSFHGSRRIPLGDVASVDQVERPLTVVRDVRPMIPTARFASRFPGVLYGSKETMAGWDIYAIHGHGPGIRIIFKSDAPFARLIATLRRPTETVATLRRALQD